MRSKGQRKSRYLYVDELIVVVYFMKIQQIPE
jgi:hypothetical protein